MKKACYCIGLMLCVSAFAVFGESVSGTFLKREGVGTGGTNWAEWSDAANWVDGIVPGGDEAAAKLSEAAGRYLRLPSSLSLKSLSNANSDPVVLLGEGSYSFNPRSPGDGAKNCYLYMPLDYSVKASDNYAGFNGGCQFCGPIGRKISGMSARFDGKVSFRYDLYATDSNENRQISAFPGSDIDLDAWATLRFIAPRSAPELSSRWVQTEGSAFLKPAEGEAAHVLAVGTVVTGEGIAPGTFLRRVFPDGSIELSAPCALSFAANTLTFAAFAPKTVAKLANRIRYYNGVGIRYVIAQKYRAEDDFTLVIPYFQIAYAGDGNKQRYYYFRTEEGFFPAKIQLGYIHESYNPTVYLENCHLQLSANTKTDGTVAVRMDNSAHTARITVTNGLSLSFGRLERLKGTLVKDGAGTLKMSVAENAASSAAGKIVVEEGTFSPEFVSAGTNEIASLTVKSGARFVIPEGVTLKVEALTVEEGSVLSGPGRLVAAGITDDILRSIVFENALAIDDGRSNGGFGFEILRGTPRMAAQDGDSIMIFDEDALIRINAKRTFDLLLVGGGGGGGAKGGGGGGGGGVVYTQSFTVASGVYVINVGKGGLGAKANPYAGNTSGGNSAFSELTAYGGGAGGTYSIPADDPNFRDNRYNGFVGGSGGGGGIEYPGSNLKQYPGGAGVPGQGYDGGKGFNYKGTYNVPWAACAGGGGGGAGSPGTDAGITEGGNPSPIGGNGGCGILCEIYGSKYYGGGGAGGTSQWTKDFNANFRGGLGGGGDGGRSDGNGNLFPGANGIDGLGGGGGGGGTYLPAGASGAAGGDGGDGIVIMRWRQPQVEETALPHEAVASGGTFKRKGGYMIHTFDVDDMFKLSEPTLVDILLVGGGGGGGWRHGGGGGGGGVLVFSNVYLLAGSYAVTVGEGGSAGVSGTYNGTTGGNSIFSFGGRGNNLIAYGGGGGGCAATGPSDAGKAGGSGGGGGAPYFVWTNVSFPGGEGVAGQGFGGGMGIHTYNAWQTSQGGGGGGAGARGGDATTSIPGNGGNGLMCDYGGSEVFYGGGGGGGSANYTHPITEYYASTGGVGGGGRGGGVIKFEIGGTIAGEDGVEGLGGGGGGGGGAADHVSPGGKGGRGVVIVRYRTKVIKTAIIVR